MLDIRSAANEPVLSVLICTSPMPMTGFTVTVRKSETLDLNITIDQAFQFIVSCGVVVPPQQIVRMASNGSLATEAEGGDVLKPVPDDEHPAVAQVPAEGDSTSGETDDPAPAPGDVPDTP
jgi:uncharacterized membrane protein